jgi:hypothetical protein
MSETTISPPPELQVLKSLQSTCTLLRRTPNVALAKAVIAEEERIMKRIERLEAAAAMASVPDAPTEEVPA